MMVSRCGEVFRMVLNLRGDLRSQRWFQAWVISETSTFFQDRVRIFSTFWSFGGILEIQGKLQDSLMSQRNFQVSKMVQERSPVREIRVFSGWNFFGEFGCFRLLMVVSRSEERLRGGSGTETCQGDPGFWKSSWDLFRFLRLPQLPMMISRSRKGLRGDLGSGIDQFREIRVFRG